MIRQFDGVLASEHLSPGESIALIEPTQAMGLQKVVITHTESNSSKMAVTVQKELSGKGVFFERCYLNTTSAFCSPVRVSEIAATIRTVGVETTVLAIDLRMMGQPPPVEGMRAYLAELSAEGFTHKDLLTMAGN